MRKVIVVLALTFAATLSAQTNDLGLWYAHGTVDSTGDEEASVDFDDASGYGISFNHHFTPSVSVEVGAVQISSEGTLNIPGFGFELGDLDVTAVTAIAQFHFGTGRIRPYVGAGAAYVMADDLDGVELLEIDAIEIDSEFGWVANAGVSFNVTSRFAVGLDAKYIPYSPASVAGGDPESTEDLDLNPVIISAGVRFRF